MAQESVQVEYSAIMSMEMSAGVMSGPYSYTPTKQRREMDLQGQSIITISRLDKGVTWQLMPDQQMYMESKIGAAGDDQPTDMSDYTIELTDLGREEVNGFDTIKSKMIMTSKKGEKFGGFSWRTDEGITIKSDAIAMADGSKERIKMELTDLVIAPQDPANFEIPKGYSAMNMSSMMMQGMMGSGADDEAGDDDVPTGDEDAPPPKKSKWGGLKGALDILK
ncbi:MAG: DUF4412 domain-containing protein [Gammaproteobacteria bacterium]|nr:DUF4412 domain-containing protein [Gammaproteobacteria bacterium]